MLTKIHRELGDRTESTVYATRDEAIRYLASLGFDDPEFFIDGTEDGRATISGGTLYSVRGLVTVSLA